MSIGGLGRRAGRAAARAPRSGSSLRAMPRIHLRLGDVLGVRIVHGEWSPPGSPRAASSESPLGRRGPRHILARSASSRSSPRRLDRSSSSVRSRVIVPDAQDVAAHHAAEMPASMMAWKTSCAAPGRSRALPAAHFLGDEPVHLVLLSEQPQCVGTLASAQVSVTRPGGADWRTRPAAGPRGSSGEQQHGRARTGRAASGYGSHVTLTSSAPGVSPAPELQRPGRRARLAQCEELSVIATTRATHHVPVLTTCCSRWRVALLEIPDGAQAQGARAAFPREAPAGRGLGRPTATKAKGRARAGPPARALTAAAPLPAPSAR